MKAVLRRALVAALTLGALVAAGCGSSSPSSSATGDAKAPTAPAREGGTLRVALAADPEALDPDMLGTVITWEAMLPMCESLYKLDGRGEPVPQLATAMPKPSADGLSVTIPLRANVVFNDGTPFDAAAVKASIERAKARSRFFQTIPLAGIETPNATTVVIKLSAPYAPLAADLAGPAGMVVSPTQLRKLGDARFGADPVCVGPFAFASRTAGSSLTLKRSARYYDKSAIHLDEIQYRVIADPSARTLALRSGDVDAIETVNGADVASLEANKQVQVAKGLSLGWAGFFVNVANSNGVGRAPKVRDTPLARSAAVRQAFSLALDRSALVNVNPGGVNRASCSFISSVSRYYDDPPCPAADPAKAKQTIASAGVRGPVPVDLLVPTGPSVRVAQAVQQMLDDGGFKATITTCEPVSCSGRWVAGSYDVALFGFGGLPDPDANISPFVTSTGGFMITGMANPRVDALLAQARAEYRDPAHRAALYKQALGLVRADGAEIVIANTGYTIATRSNVTGYVFTPAGVTYYAGAGFTKDR